MGGQVLIPGNNGFDTVFTPNDGLLDGADAAHSLTVIPEEAMVFLDHAGQSNPVAVAVASGQNPVNQAFTMHFWAFEMNTQPFGEEADEGRPNALEDDFNSANVIGTITFTALAPEADIPSHAHPPTSRRMVASTARTATI